MPQVMKEALEHLEKMDELSFARAGGGAIQSLGILSPGDWAGSAEELGSLIKKEIEGNLSTYVQVARELEKHSVAHVDRFLLASSLCNVAGIMVLVGNCLKKDSSG